MILGPPRGKKKQPKQPQGGGGSKVKSGKEGVEELEGEDEGTQDTKSERSSGILLFGIELLAQKISNNNFLS